MPIKHFDLHTLAELAKLGLVRRLMHRRTRRHILGVLLGFGFMLFGSTMALSHAYWCPTFPHVLWDCIAYFVHAAGTIPLLKHVEPLWEVITLEAEDLA